ncbi:MAG: radical SAM protein, partial [Deltaproteobacteria bacterium]|nr:radical SAM protein [Deltaproteobacteria bacterium]
METMPYSVFSEHLFSKAAEQKKPLRGQIELTYRCNVRCVHCYTDCFNNPEDIQKEMDTGSILRLVDEMQGAGCLWLCLTGGEIFMRRDFFQIYDYCLAKGFILTLFTNATMITEEIADRLAAHPPFSIETSCHGVGEVFDRVVQVPGSFRKFDEGIRRLLKRELPVQIKTKAMTLNRNHLNEIEDYVTRLGLEFSFSTAIHPDLKGSEKTTHYRLTPQEIAELEMEGGVDEEEGCRGSDDSFQKPSETLYRCGCGTNTFLMGAHGWMASCVFGRQIEKKWDPGQFQERVQALFEETRSLKFKGVSPCRRCMITLFCDKKPGVLALQGKNPEDPDRYFCETAHAKAAKVGFKIKSP